jgi:hypothetical protein
LQPDAMQRCISGFRVEASTKFLMVHNSDYYVETCLISANLYGKMSYLVLSSTILPGACAPP